jgi:hypothetical protein
MKKFLAYILSILLIIIVSLYLLDFIYTYGYHQGTPRNKISHLMQTKNDTIDYIFIGSSRVDNTINADIISSITGNSAINLGFQGAKTDDYLIILKLLKNKNIYSKQIFIQIDYVYNIDGNSEILKSEFMPFLNNQVISEVIKERDPEYFQLKYIPFYRYLIYDYKIGFREFFNTTFGNSNKLDLQNGYFPKHGRMKNSNGSTILPSHILEENKNILAINSFALKNELEIIYFTAPFCPNTSNLNYIRKLKNKLPQFLDYSDLFPSQYNYFYDCNHLNDEGATIFSEIFAQDILKIAN